MKFNRILLTAVLCAAAAFQARAQVEVDYTHPQKYIIGGVTVEGNTYFSDQQIIQQSGLVAGREITVPGDDMSNILKKLTLQNYFEDVGLYIDHLSESRDTAWFRIELQERPRISRWSFTGVKSGEKKEIQERLNIRRGGEFSQYVESTSIGIIKRYYAEKGFFVT